LSRLNLCLAALILILALSPNAHSGIVNLRGGVGTIVQKDRDTDGRNRYGVFLLAASHRTPSMEFILDLPLRWEFKTGEFDDEIWNRKGDWLKPLELLRYRSGTGEMSGGLEIFTDWTPGEGFLVRNLSGRGEPDYALPGFRFRWSGRNLDLDAGMDRLVDPTVQAIALTFRPVNGIRLVAEVAVDPDAPAVFSGDSSDGRPVADDSERLEASAVGVHLDLIDGKIMDVGIGVHVAEINGDAKGTGGEISTTVDFTQSYLNRLKVMARSVRCEDGYVPSWFDAVYPLQRWGTGGQPLLAIYPLNGTGDDRDMMSYSINYDLGDFFSISADWERFLDDSMSRGRFEAKLREENGRGLELSFWSRTDDPGIRLFTEDANLHSRASAFYNILPHLLLKVSMEYSWVFREENSGFVPLNSSMIGVLYDISL
jgi:hypothetical protein